MMEADSLKTIFEFISRNKWLDNDSLEGYIQIRMTEGKTLMKLKANLIKAFGIKDDDNKLTIPSVSFDNHIYDSKNQYLHSNLTDEYISTCYMNLALSGANLIHNGSIIIDDSTELQQKAYHMLMLLMSEHNRMEIIEDKIIKCFNSIQNLNDDHINGITDDDIMFAVDLQYNLYDYFIVSMCNNQYKQAVIALAGHIIESYLERDPELLDDKHNSLYAVSMIRRSNDDFITLMRVVIPMLTMPDEPLIESLKANLADYDADGNCNINEIINHLCNGHDVTALRASLNKRRLPRRKFPNAS